MFKGESSWLVHTNLYRFFVISSKKEEDKVGVSANSRKEVQSKEKQVSDDFTIQLNETHGGQPGG